MAIKWVQWRDGLNGFLYLNALLPDDRVVAAIHKNGEWQDISANVLPSKWFPSMLDRIVILMDAPPPSETV
jgi:hypothetical protein